jgi:hypothetical protein
MTMPRQRRKAKRRCLGVLLAAVPTLAWCEGTDPAASASSSDPHRAVYYEQLERIIPDWQQINRDSDFLKWLDAVPDGRSTTRRKELMGSYKGADATASARIFERWLAGTDRPMPLMRREDLLRIGAVTFDDACRACHTLADATRLIAAYSSRTQRRLAKSVIPPSIPTSVSLFFVEPPDGRHAFPARASFEVAGLVTLLTENAFGGKPEAMQSGAIEAERLVSRMAGTVSRIDPPPLSRPVTQVQ